MGKVVRADGACYEGGFRFGKFHGFGVLIANGWKSEGHWLNDFLDGFAKQTYPSGVVFEGNFTEGSYDGLGTLHFPDGKIIRGEWKNDYPTRLSIERPGREGSITYIYNPEAQSGDTTQICVQNANGETTHLMIHDIARNSGSIYAAILHIDNQFDGLFQRLPHAMPHQHNDDSSTVDGSDDENEERL
jgi:hypothetical protein